jgi:cytoskeletal protein CcmA (bactofilin family)
MKPRIIPRGRARHRPHGKPTGPAATELSTLEPAMNDHDEQDNPYSTQDDESAGTSGFDVQGDAPADGTVEAPVMQAAEDQALPVDIGRALPPTAPQRLPLLSTGSADHMGSTIAEGIHFAGNATLRGACSVAGTVEGHLRQAEGAFVAVVVTETGRVKGDISAQRISVMGQTEGVLDAGTGEVSLHDGSNVQGTVRYGRIQVNGANLNATLERVAPTQR